MGAIDSLGESELVTRIRDAARALEPDRVMDELELRHLSRVITECSLLLSDVYSEDRIARIMHPDRDLLGTLVDQLIDQQARGEGEALYRVRRLPDDVRVVGDKALFDRGFLQLAQVKGYDLQELGARAYRMAGEVLEKLADDRRLRRFFKENRLLMLPLEEEVVFLRQCAERFARHAEILNETLAVPDPGRPRTVGELAVRVPLMSAAARATAGGQVAIAEAAEDAPIPYLDAAREDGSLDGRSRDQTLSTYERILLFSSLALDDLRGALNATIVDQQTAIQTLCDEFSLFAAGTRDLRRPPAYFLVGPTGVGKNYVVESLCRLLQVVWEIEIPTLTIEGPNYTYPSDINELRGATRGFIRSDEEGILTTFHKSTSRAPLGVMLIDEVEKAHPQLLTFFLSILDRGTTTDNRGDVLDFSNCLLFFTSNLGYSDQQQRSAPIGYMEEDARDEAVDGEIRRDLRHGLKPEFMNRVRMVHFERLTRSSADRILDLEFEKIARRYEEVHGLRIELDDSAREELIRRGFSADFGARHLTSTLEAICNVEIAKKVRRDDRGVEGDRESLVVWLREMRAGTRPFQEEDVRERVMNLARARLPYDVLRVVFDGREFVYTAGGEEAAR